MLTLPRTLTDSHSWLKKVTLFHHVTDATPLAKKMIDGLLAKFGNMGHVIQNLPDASTDLVFTAAAFNEPLNWRKALMFTARRHLKINHSPKVYTIISVTEENLADWLNHFEQVIQEPYARPDQFEFPGLGPKAYLTLFEQGKRGGAITALLRVLQTQVKCLNIVLVVGEGENIKYAHLFDMVGAYPKIIFKNEASFFKEITLRIVTTVSTREITEHKIVAPALSRECWDNLDTPGIMLKTSKRLGKRNFFTQMIKIADLAPIPMIADTIADQYSEGCFATYEPAVKGLITTITGSARPVDKEAITEDELAIIIGVRNNRNGALVKQVVGKANDSPSSEAVELIQMDEPLPTIRLAPSWGVSDPVPVSRSKLHGHRGIKSYDPSIVEFAPLDPPFYTLPVSCATEAQANGIRACFSRAESLLNPEDPRQIVFTVLPGHGVVIVEKWVEGKEPFELMIELMDEGRLVIENFIPQKYFEYERTRDDTKMILQAEE